MAEKMHLGFFIFAMISCMTLVSVSSTTTHIVGDSQGWSLPRYEGFYADWAKKRTFAVGDVLFFPYKPGLNTVVQVNKDDYDHCTTKDTISTDYRGDSSVTLDKAGDYFFFCSVGKHCEAGQKLSITVAHAHGSGTSR